MKVGGRLLIVGLVLAATPSVLAMDHVTFRRAGKSVQIAGKVTIEAKDGGLMVLDREGSLWVVQPDELATRETGGAEFKPFGRDELAKRLRAEMPPGAKIHSTAHYFVCYNTTQAYAQWCGSLYERLYRGFYTYWSRQGFELHDPEFPLVALVFDSKSSYTRYAERDLGEAAAAAINLGYYSLLTNRVTTYDLTGLESLPRSGGRTGSAALVNRILTLPGAERNVATIVHEATHQLAFNSGLHTRFADIPLWVSEGVAIFFETPDLRSSKGWRTIGAVNQVRLQQLRNYLGSRPENSLQTLLADHARFRNTATAGNAYAEAWALNYYLLRTRTQDYVRYLQLLAKKQPLLEDRPEERIAQFEASLGADLQQLDQQFIRYMLNVR